MFKSNFILKFEYYPHFIFVRNMSKKSKSKGSKTVAADSTNTKGPIKLDKDKNILVEVYAKPGAKQNAITGISEEGINIQINAPPVDGSANTELIKYMASFLGLKSNSLSLEKGHKSRNKILKISGSIMVVDIIKKINSEVPDHLKLPEEG